MVVEHIYEACHFICEETSFAFIYTGIDGNYQLLVIHPCFLPAQKVPPSLIRCFLSVEKLSIKKFCSHVAMNQKQDQRASLTRITYTRCDQHAQYYTACGKIRNLKKTMHNVKLRTNNANLNLIEKKILPLDHLHTQNDHAMLYRNACTSKTGQIKQ